MTERKLHPEQRPNCYYLLGDPDVKRWYDNVARGSVVTASIWLRGFGFIHKNLHRTPKDLAKMTSKEAASFMLDVVSTMERNCKRGGYISGVMKPMKSWFAWNEILTCKRSRYADRSIEGKKCWSSGYC